jgi:hypothetical protein
MESMQSRKSMNVPFQCLFDNGLYQAEISFPLIMVLLNDPVPLFARGVTRPPIKGGVYF